VFGGLGAAPSGCTIACPTNRSQAASVCWVRQSTIGIPPDGWRQASVETARAAWKAWWDKALASAIPPLVRFARNILPYLDGILASAAWPLNTSVLEGINNKIKIIKRPPTASATTHTSSSKSEPHSPEFRDEPEERGRAWRRLP